MLDMPPMPTVAPTVVEHVLQWSNSTVPLNYFPLAKNGQELTATLPNSSDKPVRIKPSQSNGSAILNRLRTFASWQENWDGEGAAAPNLNAIDIASNFLSLWSPDKIKPEIVLTHDGLPMFVIDNGKMIGEIIVNPDKTLDYFFEYADGSMKGDEAVPFDVNRKPSLLSELALA